MLASEHELASLVTLCSEDPNMMVEVFNENRKKKQNALSAKNKEMWQALLEEEKQFAQQSLVS